VYDSGNNKEIFQNIFILSPYKYVDRDYLEDLGIGRRIILK
jgi:hypothetical protein